MLVTRTPGPVPAVESAPVVYTAGLAFALFRLSRAAHVLLRAVDAERQVERNLEELPGGVLEEGAAADVVVYNLDELSIDPPWIGAVEHDLPAGEWRRVQRAIGYRAILVNGEVTFEDGECTGATPGKLLRHGKDD